MLAEEIARRLDISLCKVELDNFANGETSCRLLESVRGDDVFIIQSHCNDVNDAIMEQAIMIDAAKRASARSITAVCPFFAYARQDRKSNGREPITARLVVDILSTAGADRIMTMDLHSGQIQGFMDGPLDHLVSRPLFVEYIKDTFPPDQIVIVSPDAGRVKSAERYANDLSCEIAIIHKHRSRQVKNSVEAKHLIGTVKDKICIVVDDMADTAGTLCAAADLLVANGAREVHGVVGHGIFSDPAATRLHDSAFTSVITTDTFPARHDIDKLEVVSVAAVFAQAIEAVATGGSISEIFNKDNQQ